MFFIMKMTKKTKIKKHFFDFYAWKLFFCGLVCDDIWGGASPPYIYHQDNTKTRQHQDKTTPRQDNTKTRQHQDKTPPRQDNIKTRHHQDKTTPRQDNTKQDK